MRRFVTICVALIALGLGLLGAGCGKNECLEDQHCGLDQSCVDGECVDVVFGCASSTDCPMEKFCDHGSGVCQDGCEYDNDCYPYHRCDDSGQCVAGGCRSTVLDCAMGEFCNPLTGECFEAVGDYCRECEHEDDCGAGNMCLSIGYSQTYCGVDCAMGQECPRGYECGRVQDVAGNILGYQCITACWLLE